MDNHIVLIRKKDLVTNKWAGGLTTEIAIYPQNAVYSERNFTWRISSAKVELESSTFTSLHGYDRLLMCLEGQLKLTHQNHHSSLLHPFDVDSFSGSWQTTSQGMVTDFNVIFKEGLKAELFAKSITKETLQLTDCHQIITDSLRDSSLLIYCNGASLVVEVDHSKDFHLLNGDTLFVQICKKSLFPTIHLRSDSGDTSSAIIAQVII
jgi:environmental stress-induced protein Ves